MDEVRACQWWWNRQEGVEPHVLQLDVDDNDDCIILAGLGQGEALDPEDWGGEDAQWAPCLPPDIVEAAIRVGAK